MSSTSSRQIGPALRASGPDTLARQLAASGWAPRLGKHVGVSLAEARGAEITDVGEHAARAYVPSARDLALAARDAAMPEMAPSGDARSSCAEDGRVGNHPDPPVFV